MKFYLQMCMSLMVIWRSLAAQPISRLAGLSELCRYQNICSNTSERRPEYPTAFNTGCCTECSCEPDCSMDGSCCFTSMNNVTDRKYQTCISTQIEGKLTFDEYSEAYFMVTEKPQDGCVLINQGPTDLANDSERDVNSAIVSDVDRGLDSDVDNDLAPWGSLSPVTSLKTGVIYKNKQLANCHGENEIVFWMAYLACDRFETIDGNLADCDIIFDNPDTKEAILRNRCYTEGYSKCPQKFNLNSQVTITREDVITGCESDFQSQYGTSLPYKNVYCFLCITGEKPLSINSKYCTGNHIRAHLSEVNSFVSLIDLNTQGPHLKQTTQGHSPEVCLMQHGKMTSYCRKLLCPSGQVRSRLTGSCTFLSSSWIMRDLMIVVKVNIRPHIGFTNHELINLITGKTLQLGWKEWTFIYVVTELYRNYQLNAQPEGLNLERYHAGQLTATHFYVAFRYDGQEVNPKLFIDQVKTSLAAKVYFEWRNTTIMLTQSLANFDGCFGIGFSVYGINGHPCAPHSHIARTGNGSFFFEVTNLYKKEYGKELRRSEWPRSKFFFSKMLSCSQVELQPDEFELLYGNFLRPVLALVEGGAALHDGEFELSSKISGERVIRVCLDDSGFVLPSSAGMSRYYVAIFQGLIVYVLD